MTEDRHPSRLAEQPRDLPSEDIRDVDEDDEDFDDEEDLEDAENPDSDLPEDLG
jgi:hypothetical protein